MLIKISQRPFAHIGDIASEFFLSEACFTYLGGKLINVNAGKAIILTEFFTDNNRIFKVEAIEGNKSNENILAQRQDTIRRAPTVRDNLAGLNLLTKLDGRLLIKTRSFIESDIFS